MKQKIKDDMKDAMRNKQKQRLGTIRMLLAAISQLEIDERCELSDAQVMAIIRKMVKQRRDAAGQFTQAKRQELADIELAEIDILQAYLPQQMDAAQIKTAVTAAITDAGASSIKDIGKVMGPLKAAIADKADMSAVSAEVKRQLSDSNN